jgi:hypothetical protein
MTKRPSAPHIKKLSYITPPAITECIFCGAGPPLTQEHVFSRWTHRYLPKGRKGKYQSVRGVRNPSDSEHHVTTRIARQRTAMPQLARLRCERLPRAGDGSRNRDRALGHSHASMRLARPRPPHGTRAGFSCVGQRHHLSGGLCSYILSKRERSSFSLSAKSCFSFKKSMYRSNRRTSAA